MSDQAPACRRATLARRAADNRSWSKVLLDESVRLAWAVAETEDKVAGTLARLAQGQPHHASELWVKSEEAAQFAAYVRHQLNGRAAGLCPGDG